MFESLHHQRLVGRFAWAMAWFGLVAGQLHALSRHNTVDGRGDLDLPLTRLWSDPARRVLAPLLDWADPDTVYLTYGKIWLPVFAAFTACAFVVFRRRHPDGFELWAWRVSLFGYALATVSIVGDYYTQWTGYVPFAEYLFLGLTIPGLALTLLGSTLLGVALLRNGFRPRLPAWLLAVNIPLALVVLQFTSMGSAVLPVMFGFGILGRRISRESTYESVVPAPQTV